MYSKKTLELLAAANAAAKSDLLREGQHAPLLFAPKGADAATVEHAAENQRTMTQHYVAAWGAKRQEHFSVTLCDAAGRFIATHTLNVGDAGSVRPCFRTFATKALACDAKLVLMIHNHPSGSPLPSDADKALTLEWARLMDALGFALMDHVIVTPHGATSIRSIMNAQHAASGKRIPKDAEWGAWLADSGSQSQSGVLRDPRAPGARLAARAQRAADRHALRMARAARHADRERAALLARMAADAAAAAAKRRQGLVAGIVFAAYGLVGIVCIALALSAYVRGLVG